jgi:hypothetical protein
MLDPDNRLQPRLREDVVVSVCFSDPPPRESAFRAVRELAARLDAVYRFREIILVVEDTQREAFLDLIAQVPDVRLFVVGPATDFYERRVIAAEEAIGDLVLLASAHEIEHLDALAFLDHAERENVVTLATRLKHSLLTTCLTIPIIAVGRIAGFKVNLNDLQTVAMPRTLLNQMLAHEEPRLALRFPPRDAGSPFVCLRVDAHGVSRRRIAGLPRRAHLLQTLLVYLAPMLLSLVALSSSVLALLGILYAAYIVGAWFMVEDLAPGWLTTSAMLTVSAVFMGVSMLGLSLGLQHLLRKQGGGIAGRVPEEVNRIDLFGKVASDLNVERASGRGRDPHIETAAGGDG